MATTDRLSGQASETGLAIKAPCAAATTGSNILLSGIQTIDGTSVGSASERVLVKDQTDATTNGIYIASSGNWTRAPDAAGNTDWTAGAMIYVQRGSANAGVMYAQTCADSPVIIGTSLISFVSQGALNSVVPTRTATATPITVSGSDRIIFVDTTTIGAAVTVNLPASSAFAPGYAPVTIKDNPSNGIAGTRNITINPNVAETIDGLTSVAIKSNRGWYTLKPLSGGGYAIL